MFSRAGRFLSAILSQGKIIDFLEIDYLKKESSVFNSKPERSERNNLWAASRQHFDSKYF